MKLKDSARQSGGAKSSPEPTATKSLRTRAARGNGPSAVSMKRNGQPRCLRCGAGAEWIETSTKGDER